MALCRKRIRIVASLLVTLSACSGNDESNLAGSGGAMSAQGGGLGEGGAPTRGSDSAFVPTPGGATSAWGGAPSVGGGSGANGASKATVIGTTVIEGGSFATSTARGGNSPTGGNTAKGGATAKGGNTLAGGATAKGGSTSAGGGTNTGSCQESTCGSHKWPCWKVPTPPSLNLPNPQSYTDLGNGAVRDNVTCLVWEKANPSAGGTLQASIDRCAALASGNYAGFSDWRMPTRVEMASITDVTLGSKGFPAVFTTSSGYYMTGSDWYKTILTDNDATAGNETNMVWGYGTNGFTSNAIVRTGTNLVARCVRGNGAGEQQGQYAVEPAAHYTVTGTGTDAIVEDNYTGLIWQQTFSTSRMPWSDAASYCAAQTTGGLSGWRVPALSELASTVNEALVAPAINRTVFPNTNKSCDPDGWYWAMEASKVGGTAWGLSYCDGYTGWNAGADSAKWNYFIDGWVRCVR